MIIENEYKTGTIIEDEKRSKGSIHLILLRLFHSGDCRFWELDLCLIWTRCFYCYCCCCRSVDRRLEIRTHRVSMFRLKNQTVRAVNEPQSKNNNEKKTQWSRKCSLVQKAQCLRCADAKTFCAQPGLCGRSSWGALSTTGRDSGSFLLVLRCAAVPCVLACFSFGFWWFGDAARFTESSQEVSFTGLSH